jgi:hypothetical protein
MAVLGYDTQATGNTNQFLFSDGMGSKFTSIEAGSIDIGKAYVYNPNAGDNPIGTLAFSVFSHDSGGNQPDVLLAYGTNDAAIPPGISIVEFTLTESFAGAFDFANAETLWLNLWPDNPSSHRGLTDAGGTNQSAELSQATSWPTWEDPMPAPGAYQNIKLSIWVDYTPAATGSKRLTLLGVG